jgi:membrane associated rhomboid family serine protease
MNDDMGDEMAVVFETRSRQAVSDRALVLHSLGIPYQIINGDLSSALMVPAEVMERAKFELWQYEQENRPRPKESPMPIPRYQDGIAGIVLYIIILCAVAWLAGESAFGKNWFAAGRIDGELIRQGQWWRAMTALTLHGGLRHLLGNIGFGALFGYFAGRLLGSGIAWFAILASATGANLLNTVLLESAHRSVGASTAVFAALGLLAGFVWRARFMIQDRWPYRIGPIVGGIALLAYTGTGDQNTDIGAHLTGFVCGFAAGMILTALKNYLANPALQRIAALATITSLALTWMIAL